MKALGVAGLGAFGNLLGSLAGIPWQALMTYTIIAAFLTSMVAIAQIVVPQDSHDKLLWWDKLLRRRARPEKPVAGTNPASPQAPAAFKDRVGRQRRTAGRERPPARSP